MVKTDWGTKHTCQGCGARYYDLNRKDYACPQCGAKGGAERPTKPRGGAKAAAKAAAKPKPKKVAEKVIDEAVENESDTVNDDIDDEADDDLIEDTSDLGEDDVTGIVERTGDKDE